MCPAALLTNPNDVVWKFKNPLYVLGQSYRITKSNDLNKKKLENKSKINEFYI